MAGDEGTEESSDSKDRDRVWSYPELLYCLFAALGINEKFSAGKSIVVRLATLNETYITRVKWMKEQDKWRDQHGKTVTHITPEQSIQERVRAVDSKTKDTPISYQQDRVVGVYRNHIVTLLDKIVNKDDTIPTGQTFRGIRVAYFHYTTGGAEPFSSEDESTKTERVEVAFGYEGRAKGSLSKKRRGEKK